MSDQEHAEEVSSSSPPLSQDSVSLPAEFDQLSLSNNARTASSEPSQIFSPSDKSSPAFLPPELPAREVLSSASTTTPNPLYPSLDHLSLDSLSIRDALDRASATSVSPPHSPPDSLPSRNVSSSASTTILPEPLLHGTPNSISLAFAHHDEVPALQRKSSLGSIHEQAGIIPLPYPALRRASSDILLSSTSKSLAELAIETPAEEILTASLAPDATFASRFFKKELEAHGADNSSANCPEAVAILHDACYGHRYARQNTSQSELNRIVERPERLHATALGLAAAYVRLGGKYSGGMNPLQLNSEAQSIQPIPFRIFKSSRTLPLGSPTVTNVHGTEWMKELRMICENAEAKLALRQNELSRPVSSAINEGDMEKPDLDDNDLYLCAESLDALEGSLGGVCDAVDLVFADTGPKRAFVSIRPPGHHCSAQNPSGFCWLNNVHVGISHALITHGLTHAAIIDFDLHHGDGSQSITWKHNTKMAALQLRRLPKLNVKKATKSRRVSRIPTNLSTEPAAAKANARADDGTYTKESEKSAIGYFSIHDINSYPCEMGDPDKVAQASMCMENAHGQTIWNVHLQTWENELEFWKLYEERYLALINKARAFLKVHSDRVRACKDDAPPKAAILISAGFDASEWETQQMQRHGVNVPTEFYARLTRDIVALANEEGLGVDGRVISILEGGYSNRALTSGVMSHLCGFSSTGVPRNSRNLPKVSRFKPGELLSNQQPNDDPGKGEKKEFGVLDDLEKDPHAASILHYDRQWWIPAHLQELENLEDPPKRIAKAPILRDTLNRGNPIPTNFSMIPPEVSWTTATHELCKLLVPTDRPTKSYRSEELKVEASRIRRIRQSIAGAPSEPQRPPMDDRRMQLRVKKP